MFDQYFSQNFWQYYIIGNSIKDYLFALIVFIALIVVFKIFQILLMRYFKKLAKKTKTDIDDTLLKIISSIRPPFYLFLAFYLGLNMLVVQGLVKKIIELILIVWIVYQVINAVQILISYVAEKKMQKDEAQEQGNDPNTQTAVNAIKIVTKIILWTLGLLLILSNFGVNITSLIAGLGIGGIAVALALQNVLSDLFGSFAIYFDKPFQIGDFIIVGDKMGVVEKIGIKTTRVQALQGEEIVFSNKELTSAQIQNFKKMKERRISFTFGVIYETSGEKLKKIPTIIENIINNTKLTRFDRSHFKSFGSSSLDFENVYYLKSSNYNQYMDIQQEINFKIQEAFAKQKISMAYPTQTVYFHKE